MRSESNRSLVSESSAPSGESRPPRSQRSLRAALIGASLVVLSAVGFSGKAVLAKVLYRMGVDPLSVIGLRMGFSFPVFAALAIRTEWRSPRLRTSELAAVLALGGIGYYASVYGDFAGLAYISAGLERLVMFTYPTLVVVMAAFAFKQRISRLQLGCLLLTYAGIALAFRAEAPRPSRDLFLGAALVFASAFCYAAYLVAGTKYIHRLGAQRFTSLALSAACGSALVHAAVERRSLLGFSPSVYWLALLMAMASTVMPAFALSLGIRRIGPGPAAVLGTTGPVSTLFLAHVALGEPLTLVQLAGATLVVAGATLVATKGR